MNNLWSEQDQPMTGWLSLSKSGGAASANVELRSVQRKGFAHSWVRPARGGFEGEPARNPAACFDTSRNGWIEQADQASAELLGAKDRGSLVGRHLAELFIDSRELSSFFAMARGASPVSDLIVDLRRLDGSPLIVRISSSDSARFDGQKSWVLTPIKHDGSW